MTDAELGKYLKQKDWLHWDTDSVDEAAMTILLALLEEAEAAIAWGMSGGDDAMANTLRLDAVRRLQDRLRVVLGPTWEGIEQVQRRAMREQD